MRTTQYPPYTIVDPVETPGGILVSARSADDLIKAEAKKIAKQNKASFFSRFGVNQMSNIWGAREKPLGTPLFEMLYSASKQSVIDGVIIRNRVDQVKRIWKKAQDGSKEPGYKVVHERHEDKDYSVTKSDLERCREIENLLNDPTPERFSDIYPHRVRPHTRLKDFVSVSTKAELIIDRKVLLRYRRRDGEGYSAFHWLPGSTIKPVDEMLKEWARKNEPSGKITRETAYRLSMETGLDITKAAYVQIIDGMITGAFTSDEISIHISNPSDELNRWGYGISRLELSLDITTQLLYAFTYNKELFKTNYPEAILTVAGDFDKEGLAAFQQQIMSTAGGVGNNWRLPVIPAGDVDGFKLESHKLRDTPKDMLFDNMIRLLMMLKAAAYGAHPQALNLSTDSGNGASLFGASPEAEIEFSDEQGLLPMVDDMSEWLTDAIVKPRYDDLKLVVVGLKQEDERQAIDIRSQRASKWMTRNEARKQEGMEAIGDEKDPENPWNYPSDVPIPNYINTFNMMDQQQQQGQDEGDDSQDQEEDVQKSMRHHIKPQPIERQETKYLKITIGE